MCDTHLGHEDQRLLDVLGNYVEENRWDYWIHLGDLLDLGSIAPFNQGRPRKVSNEASLRRSYDLGNKFLDTHLQAARSINPTCEAVILQGNHEERIERLVDVMPQLEGIVEPESNLEFKRRNVKWIPYWSTGELYRLGKCWFGHGFRTNVYHSAAHVRDYGASVVYGHTHDVQRFPIKRLSDKSVIYGQSLGCTCDLNPPWMKGRPQNWQHAFGVMYLYPDGNFQLNVVDVFKYRFVAPGSLKVYQG
jgi:hypothetical protein